jgi:hypothetical protein
LTVIAMSVEHPAWDELQAYGQGRIAPEEALAVEEHLAICTTCCDRLEQAPGDSFLGRLRAAGVAVSTVTTEAPGGFTTVDASVVPPELVDHPRYRVLGLIGQGGMGAVYRAEHRRMERLVALKVIHPGLMDNVAAVERFRQEVRAAARLQHPNIVTAHDADQAGRLHFLVMEHVEGISLADLIRTRGPLPVAEACACIRQAALGLQHAHEQGMVHRDVKPHNLMLQPSGTPQGGVVKILDFGLARLLRTPDGPRTGPTRVGALTSAGVVMGTADYMAPEQASDPSAADIRADIYSLGCTLFFLLTGQPPFPDGSVADKLARHAGTPLPPVRGLRPEVPPALAAVLSRMTARDPTERHTTPAEVAAALAPFCPVPLQRAGRLSRRRRLAAILALLAAGLLSGALFLCIRGQRDEQAIEAGDRTPAPTGTAGSRLTAGADEEPAAEMVRKLGGRFHRDGLAPGMPTVLINLGNTKVTDADLRTVAACTHLRSLDMSHTAITDVGLRELSGLRKLQSLLLGGLKVTDAGIEALAELTELQILDLSRSEVTSKGLHEVAKHRRLINLNLQGAAQVTDAALKELAGMPQLETLVLAGTPVTDQGIAELAHLPQLRHLVLANTHLTDAALDGLASCVRLQYVGLSRTRVTEAGVAKLQAARPNLRIQH